MAVQPRRIAWAISNCPKADEGIMTIFYPTDAAEASVHQGRFRLSWAEEAQPRRGNGRLVVIHVDLARVLVEHGVTVALPQHAGHNVHDPSTPGLTSRVKRPTMCLSAAGPPTSDCAEGPKISFAATRSGRRMSHQGRQPTIDC